MRRITTDDRRSGHVGGTSPAKEALIVKRDVSKVGGFRELLAGEGGIGGGVGIGRLSWRLIRVWRATGGDGDVTRLTWWGGKGARLIKRRHDGWAGGAGSVVSCKVVFRLVKSFEAARLV